MSKHKPTLGAPSDHVVRLLEGYGGSVERNQAVHQLTSALGYRRARIAVGLAIAGGRVVLTDDDQLERVMRLESCYGAVCPSCKRALLWSAGQLICPTRSCSRWGKAA